MLSKTFYDFRIGRQFQEDWHSHHVTIMWLETFLDLFRSRTSSATPIMLPPLSSLSLWEEDMGIISDIRKRVPSFFCFYLKSREMGRTCICPNGILVWSSVAQRELLPVAHNGKRLPFLISAILPVKELTTGQGVLAARGCAVDLHGLYKRGLVRGTWVAQSVKWLP